MINASLGVIIAMINAFIGSSLKNKTIDNGNGTKTLN